MCQSCQPAQLSRRRLLQMIGLGGAASVAPVAVRHARAAERERVELTTTVVGAGTYAYLAFDVPRGVNRLRARLSADRDASLGLGIFDHRGPGYQSAGFRGVYGAERHELMVAADDASPSFLPGPIEAGRWTVIVPVFEAPVPTEVTVTVTMELGPESRARRIGPTCGVVRGRPGWYRGDLHAHTPESSDAAASGTALTPRQWARTAADIGLDFVALTDHNVVTQNLDLARDAAAGGGRVLLMPGEEMTNWAHGHATVSGLADPAGWIDWRQRPGGVPLQEHERRIAACVAAAHEQGAYVAAAHPFFANLSWQFFADAERDPAARTDGIEVWTAQFRPDCETALAYWDDLLVRGQRIFANGGSDLHGVENDLGFEAGTPTTVVHAERLETQAVVAALKQGRAYLTRRPDGVELYLTAQGPRDQHQIVGGTIHGQATDTVRASARVRRGSGTTLVFVTDGQRAQSRPVGSDDETVAFERPIATGGYVRAEVRGAPTTSPQAPLSGHTGMEALTNRSSSSRVTSPRARPRSWLPWTDLRATRAPCDAG